MEIHTIAAMFALICAIFGAIQSTASPSEADLTKQCKYVNTSSSGGIKSFVHVDKFTNKQMNDKDDINFTIWAKAKEDFHIAVSSIGSLPLDDAIYHIMFYDDGKCVFLYGFAREKVVQTPGIVSATEYRPYTLRLARNGSVSVNVTAAPTSFAAHTYSKPVNVQWIGFCAWNRIIADIYFGCVPAKGRLWDGVFEGKNLTALASPKYEVNAEFASHNLTCSQQKWTIESSGRLVAEWQYANISWNPLDYDNVTAYDFEYARGKQFNLTVTITGYVLIVPLRSVSYKGKAYAELQLPIVTAQCSDQSSLRWPHQFSLCKVVVPKEMASQRSEASGRSGALPAYTVEHN